MAEEKQAEADAGCAACTGKKTHRDEALKRSLDARLARIEGQVRGLRRMISEDAYCDDVLAQASAVRAALGKASLVVLEHHMKHCLIDRVRAGEEDIVDELVDTLGRMI
ncbi:MAG TPA: CsoR family transcriptional regulator [Spirochaetaceae bacterium]|nr:CsoR family transcriptional regulator [Spirochaetaceae bacterium]